MTDSKKVAVNGTTSLFNPTTQDQINMALLQNGGIKRIQTTLQDRLDEAGWSQNVRDYVERLFRSGDATTYDEAVKRVMSLIQMQGPEENGVRNGSGPDLSLPREALQDAAEVVKRELTKVTTVESGK